MNYYLLVLSYMIFFYFALAKHTFLLFLLFMKEKNEICLVYKSIFLNLDREKLRNYQLLVFYESSSNKF